MIESTAKRLNHKGHEAHEGNKNEEHFLCDLRGCFLQ